MEQNQKYCEALKKGTAFEEMYKGCFDRILCEENPCLYGHENRLPESRCIDEKERFVCPLEKGLVEKKEPIKPQKIIKGLARYFGIN